MSLKHRLKNLVMAVGIISTLAVGYMSMSVATSNRADAILCFSGNQCITNMASTIGTSFLQVVVMKGLMAGGYMMAYLKLAEVQWTFFMKQKIKGVRKTVEQTIDTFWFYNLRPSFQAMTEQLNVADAQQALAVIKFNDAAEANRVKLDVEEAEAESRLRNQPSENACVAASVSGGMARAATITRNYNARAPIVARANASSLNPGGSSILSRSLNATGTPASNGRGADVKARFQNMSENYYDPDSNGGHGGCEGCPPGSVGKNRDLDVQGEIFDKTTIDLTNKTMIENVVNDLLVNLAEPFVLEDLKDPDINDTRVQENMLERNSYHAKRQVIIDALYHPVARRAPGSKMGAFIDELRSAAGFIPPANSNPSHNEIMQVMMSDRFRSGAYAISQVDTPEANSKEMVIQQAFQAMQLSDQLDLLDRYAMVLAASTGENVNDSKNMSPQLDDKQSRQ